MAQIAKMEAQTEVKCSAEKIYDIFKCKTYLMPKICPGKFKDIKLLQGDWESVGSVKLWTYVLVQVELNAKEQLEAVDDKIKKITHKVLEGEILKNYKSFKFATQVTAKVEGGSIVKWTLEFEKLNELIPDPNLYLDFTIQMTKDIDDYLCKE